MTIQDVRDGSGGSPTEPDSAERQATLPPGGRSRPGSRTLPTSMSSLRAFEAVARRQSFTKAAHELNQTQTAISHQVRKLESLLGVQLFVRDRHGVRLSEYGREYLPAVRSALDMLSSSTQRILDRGDEASLSIVSLAAFGLKCLLPLLPDFREKHPQIFINFESVISFNAAASYNHDVSIRYGSGEWTGLLAYKIAPEEVFPVCSPKYLERHPMLSVNDLHRQTAICTSSVVFRDDWQEWLSLVGRGDDTFADTIVCDTMLSASQAAIDGLGVAMGRSPLVNNDLREGRLVAPFPQRLPSSSGYYITVSTDRAQRTAVKCFIEWLLDQLQ
ncbi:MAG TPA: LysR substrate-binding domain-containing protein [Burkholderiaceae bacterium]|nr:LysR substrate-binding domain-containing protein [Burkholderiaceae bacterium]